MIDLTAFTDPDELLLHMSEANERLAAIGGSDKLEEAIDDLSRTTIKTMISERQASLSDIDFLEKCISLPSYEEKLRRDEN